MGNINFGVLFLAVIFLVAVGRHFAWDARCKSDIHLLCMGLVYVLMALAIK